METEISLTDISETDRIKLAQEAADEVFAQLRVRFPEAEGYRYSAVEDKPLEGSGFRRYVRVHRGVNFGVNVAIDATDRMLSGLKVTVIPESLLTIILGIGGFFGIMMILGVVIMMILGLFSSKPMFTQGGQGSGLTDEGVLFCLGFVFLGVPLAGVFTWKLFGLLQRLSGQSAVATKELMGALTQCVTKKTKGIARA